MNILLKEFSVVWASSCLTQLLGARFPHCFGVPSFLFLKMGAQVGLDLSSEAKDDLELPTLLLEPWEDVLDVI